MQVVGYDTRTGSDDEPALLLAADREVRREPLNQGAELALSIGERHCAGSVDGFDHEPCEEPTAPYCETHTSDWPCARCTGNCSRPIEACHEEHTVYLAAFAPDRFKVGVTRSWRLETRLREQGADLAAHIHTVADGRIAREIEAELATSIPDRVRVPAKIRGLGEPVDRDAWADLLGGFDPIETYSFEYGLELETRPVVEHLASGTVRGVKGRVLVLESTGGVYAVDMRDLVGYEVERGRSDRDLQSSLGSFN